MPRGRRRGRGCGPGGLLAQAGDGFWQQGGQLGGEVEVFEAVTVPVLLQRLRAGPQDVPQLGQQRAGELGQVELRVDDHRGRFQVDQGACEQHQPAREDDPVTRSERELGQQEAGDREVSGAPAEPVVDGVGERGAKAGWVGAGEEFRHAQELAADGLVVAIDERPEDEGHPPPLAGVKPPEHAEIDEADPVTAQEQNVARVGVGMEQPELENLAQHRRGACAQHRLWVDASPPQLGSGLGIQP